MSRKRKTPPRNLDRQAGMVSSSRSCSNSQRAGNGILQLQAAAGNRAVRGLVAQRDVDVADPLLGDMPGAEAPSPHDRGFIVEGAAPPSRSGGKRLPTQLREQMERSFGTGLDNVKVHENEDLARDIGARAVTVGNDIYFDAGSYQPHSGSGKQVIAHELTHVIQQRAGRVSAMDHANRPGLSVNTDQALENEADRGGRHAAWRLPVNLKGSGRPVTRPVNVTAQADSAQPPLRFSPAE